MKQIIFYIVLFTMAVLSAQDLDLDLDLELDLDIPELELFNENDELMDYVHTFVNLAKKEGINLDRVFKYPVKVYFGELPGGYIGYANGAENDYKIEIILNKEYWLTISQLDRKTLMYHELAHDILNVTHNENLKHIMHPNSFYNTETALKQGLKQLFNEFKTD